MTWPTDPAGPRSLRLLEESAEDLYEQAPCGYLSTLPDGTIVRVNQTLLDWIGHTREALLAGTRFQTLLTHRVADLLRNPLRAAAADAGASPTRSRWS